jgi:hypothetical protein
MVGLLPGPIASKSGPSGGVHAAAVALLVTLSSLLTGVKGHLARV